jgi:hypothetical protein
VADYNNWAASVFTMASSGEMADDCVCLIAAVKQAARAPVTLCIIAILVVAYDAAFSVE